MAVHCVKNRFGRTYFDEFMPTCLKGPVFLKHSVYLQVLSSSWGGRPWPQYTVTVT